MSAVSDLSRLVRDAVAEATLLAENSLGSRGCLLEKLSLIEDEADSLRLQAERQAATHAPIRVGLRYGESLSRPPGEVFSGADWPWREGRVLDVLEALRSAPTDQNPSSPRRSDIVAVVGQPQGMAVAPSFSGGAYSDWAASSAVWRNVNGKAAEAFESFFRRLT